MQFLKGACDILISKSILSGAASCSRIQARSIKYFPPPPNYDDIEIPEKPKLRFLEKVPVYPANIRPPKMQKRLRYMRGPEPLHNTLQHKQFGIVATVGGRLRSEHLEIIRLEIARRIDVRRMFAVWRVDPPWQPITKKGQGQRMGGGKGAIDHYVTPVKAGRVIMELAGKLEYKEAEAILKTFVGRMPVRAKIVSHELMLREAEEERRLEESNLNPYTQKYIMQNNMGGCHRWLTSGDLKWFGKYL